MSAVQAVGGKHPIEDRLRIHRIEGGAWPPHRGSRACQPIGGGAGQLGRDGGDRLRLAPIAVAMQGDVDAGGEKPFRFLAERPRQSLHRKVIGEQQPVEADRPADHLADDSRRDRRRPLAVEGGVDDVRGHRGGQVGVHREGDEVRCLQLRAQGVDDGQREMGVGSRPAVAGDVLHDRQHAGVQHALGGGAAQCRDGRRVARVGTIADDVVRPLGRHVEDRQAVDVDADGEQVFAHEPGDEPDRLGPLLQVVDRGVARGGGVAAPVRQPEPLHAAALLVDEDHRLVAAERRANVARQRVDLLPGVDVAAEENDAERVGVLQEGTLVRRKRRAEAAADEGSHAARSAPIGISSWRRSSCRRRISASSKGLSPRPC